MNTSVCNSTGKSFGKVIQHFIYGGDETCMKACENGFTKVIGINNQNKYRRKYQDSRVSIMMYRTVSVSGVTGTTIFLFEGKKRHGNYSDKLLLTNGDGIGSKIIMTPTDFMTEEAGENTTPKIIKGLRNTDPIIKANPQWWMTEVFNGFGPHMSLFKAMQMRAHNKIVCVKEEGDSSHLNHAYNKYVATQDKATNKESLGKLRLSYFYQNGVLDQWVLIHVGLFAV